MKESAQAALTYARAHADEQGIAPDYFETHDIHIHVPAGAIPKDGPSAGITITTAIISVLTGRPVRRNVAMTGEVTLRGDVLPIGGVKEKVLAARAAKINTVILPKLNERDLVDVPEPIKRDMTFHFVEHVEDVLRIEVGLLDGCFHLRQHLVQELLAAVLRDEPRVVHAVAAGERGAGPAVLLHDLAESGDVLRVERGHLRLQRLVLLILDPAGAD